VIDEVGYIPFEPEAANLFFQLVSSRYERASLIVTSNKPFGRWGEVFGDDVVAAAMIDRLVHHAEVVSLKGDSYRSKTETSAASPRPQPRTNDQQGVNFQLPIGGQFSIAVDITHELPGTHHRVRIDRINGGQDEMESKAAPGVKRAATSTNRAAQRRPRHGHRMRAMPTPDQRGRRVTADGNGRAGSSQLLNEKAHALSRWLLWLDASSRPTSRHDRCVARAQGVHCLIKVRTGTPRTKWRGVVQVNVKGVLDAPNSDRLPNPTAQIDEHDAPSARAETPVSSDDHPMACRVNEAQVRAIH
jgi:hypothetical protein